MAEELKSTVFKTALLFEGGSMRAAYTAPVAQWLLEQGVYFNKVYGVSAGSSNTVNYLSRDLWRTRVSFTDFLGDPKVGNAKTFLLHKGLLNAEYIYQQASLPESSFPFDFETFMANPADLCVVAFDRDTGEDLYFTKKDMPTLERLMLCVRASSTLPVMMPPPKIDGRTCYDGGFAVGGGLPLVKIDADGFDHMVVVRTRKRGYRREDGYGWAKAVYAHRPMLREALLKRAAHYNEAADLLDEWEKQGRAYVFYPEELTLSGTERDVELLKQNYDAGYAQIQREAESLMHFLEAAEG